ncbi:MAG: cell division ATP-binding protein FtsE [Minisyncoccia bacterium]
MIIFKNVTKLYEPNIVAIDRMSFEITSGEFVILVGKSGAGKTTILKLIRKEEEPTQGFILYKNLDYTRLKGSAVQKLRKKIGIVFQEFKLLLDRTVYDNIKIPLEILGYSNKEIKRKVEEVLRIVDLWNHAPILAKFLSGGEKQKVAIARALAVGSETLLADEPTGNLDPISAREIVEILKRINEDGITIVLATHHKDIVDYLNKRVITLQTGRIIKDENPGKYTLI